MSEASLESETFGRWLFAVGKHIAHFRSDMVATHVWATRKASQEADLLLRLRRIGTISGEKAIAYARDVGVAPQEALSFYQGLASTELIEVKSRADEILQVTERIFTEGIVYRAVASRFEAYRPNPAERALIPMLDMLSTLPL